MILVFQYSWVIIKAHRSAECYNPISLKTIQLRLFVNRCWPDNLPSKLKAPRIISLHNIIHDFAAIDNPDQHVIKMIKEMHVYQGKITDWSQIQFTFDGKYVYHGVTTDWSQVMYTFDGRYVYQGRMDDWSRVMYTYDGKHIYQGRVIDPNNKIYTVK